MDANHREAEAVMNPQEKTPSRGPLDYLREGGKLLFGGSPYEEAMDDLYWSRKLNGQDVSDLNMPEFDQMMAKIRPGARVLGDAAISGGAAALGGAGLPLALLFGGLGLMRGDPKSAVAEGAAMGGLGAVSKLTGKLLPVTKNLSKRTKLTPAEESIAAPSRLRTLGRSAALGAAGAAYPLATEAARGALNKLSGQNTKPEWPSLPEYVISSLPAALLPWAEYRYMRRPDVQQAQVMSKLQRSNVPKPKSGYMYKDEVPEVGLTNPQGMEATGGKILGRYDYETNVRPKAKQYLEVEELRRRAQAELAQHGADLSYYKTAGKATRNQFANVPRAQIKDAAAAKIGPLEARKAEIKKAMIRTMLPGQQSALATELVDIDAQLRSIRAEKASRLNWSKGQTSPPVELDPTYQFKQRFLEKRTAELDAAAKLAGQNPKLQAAIQTERAARDAGTQATYDSFVAAGGIDDYAQRLRLNPKMTPQEFWDSLYRTNLKGAGTHNIQSGETIRGALDFLERHGMGAEAEFTRDTILQDLVSVARDPRTGIINLRGAADRIGGKATLEALFTDPTISEPVKRAKDAASKAAKFFDFANELNLIHAGSPAGGAKIASAADWLVVASAAPFMGYAPARLAGTVTDATVMLAKSKLLGAARKDPAEAVKMLQALREGSTSSAVIRTALWNKLLPQSHIFFDTDENMGPRFWSNTIPWSEPVGKFQHSQQDMHDAQSTLERMSKNPL